MEERSGQIVIIPDADIQHYLDGLRDNNKVIIDELCLVFEHYQVEQRVVARALVGGTLSELQQLAEEVSPGFHKFQLLTKIKEMEDGA